MPARIELSDGSFAVVDDQDASAVLAQRPWHVGRSKTSVNVRAYIKGSTANGGTPKWVVLSHLILGRPPRGHVVDHIDGDPLNNVRENLRVVTHRQNSLNKGSRRRYKAVQPSGSGGFYARISVLGSRYHSPVYETEEEAAAAYNQLAAFFFGEFARPNEVDPSVSARVTALADLRRMHEAHIAESREVLDAISGWRA